MAPRKEVVGAAGFFALDIRAGRVVDVVDFSEARNPSWKITVDFGPEIGHLRTGAQIKNYARDDLLGRLVVGVINLGNKRIAGFTSEFLILGTYDPDGTVRLLQVEPEVKPGAVVG
ncbi:MAG: tRNA-binding protein [Actinomycetota bacterium]|nr:tRNA-binding protein [Actinomycetota bacterium]